MADSAIRMSDLPIKAIDSGDGTYRLAVDVVGMSLGTVTVDDVTISISDCIVTNVNQGTLTQVTTLADLNRGTITQVTAIANVNKGTITEVQNVTSVDTLDTVTVVDNINKGTITEVQNITSVDTLDTVTVIDNINKGTITSVTAIANLNKGTITEVTTVANVNQGTITEIQNITSIDTLDTVTVVDNLNKGTITQVTAVANLNQGTVTQVTKVVNLDHGTVTVDNIVTDFVTSAQEVIDVGHANIHDGHYYEYPIVTDIAAAGTYVIGLLTDATKYTHYRNEKLSSSAEKILIGLQEVATIAGGTTVSAINHNRTSSTVSTMVVRTGVTLSTAGTTVSIGFIGGGTANGGNRSGGETTQENEFVLKTATQYAVVITNNGAGTATISVSPQWYEESLG